MTYQDFASVAGVALGVVVLISGGIGGAVSLLANFFLNRSNQKEQARTNERLRLLETSLTTASHIQKAQYEKEVAVYAVMWEQVVECESHILLLGLRHDEEAYRDATTAHAWKLRQCIQLHLPFVSDGVLIVARKASALINEETNKVNRTLKKPDTDAFYFTLERIKEDLLKAIRSRIDEISSVSIQ